jgi:hypothetical protein
MALPPGREGEFFHSFFFLKKKVCCERIGLGLKGLGKERFWACFEAFFGWGGGGGGGGDSCI